MKRATRRSSKTSSVQCAGTIHLSEPVHAIGSSDRAHKIRIVLDGLRGEDSIAELCRSLFVGVMRSMIPRGVRVYRRAYPTNGRRT